MEKCWKPKLSLLYSNKVEVAYMAQTFDLGLSCAGLVEIGAEALLFCLEFLRFEAHPL